VCLCLSLDIVRWTAAAGDLGLAKQLAQSTALLQSQTGTLEYLSPEVQRGDPFVVLALDL
jgi:hypothetical protein